MSRLIDADALKEKFKVRHWIVGRDSDPDCLLDDAPAVDAVQVVRCHECIQSEPCLKRNSVYCNKLHDAVMRDWFCAYGERREE